MCVFSLYFANSGLKTQLNLLNTGRAWWTLAVLIILASAAKIIPVTLITKLCVRKSWYYCASMGVLMNTRGIVQLVVLNIGVQLKVISPVIFAMFVLMATILTFITSPILHLLYHRDADSKITDESKDLHFALEGLEKAEVTTISNGVVFPKLTPSPQSNRVNSIANEGANTSTQNAANLRLRRASRMTLF